MTLHNQPNRLARLHTAYTAGTQTFSKRLPLRLD